MKEPTILFGLLLCALGVLGIWWQVTVWQECRVDHSWMYCVRLISK